MVECGRVLLFRFDLAEVLYTSVNALVDRLTEALDHCSPGGTFFSDDPDSGCVDRFCHEVLISSDRSPSFISQMIIAKT